LRIRVRVYATLVERVGRRQLELVLNGDATVAEALSAAGLYEEVVESGHVRRFFKVLVNGRDIDFLDDLNTKLKDGDVLDVFPPLAGGLLGV